MSGGPVFKDKDVTSEVIDEFKKLNVGDHLAIEGEVLQTKYIHHGILTDSYTVVHFSGRDKSNATISSIDLKIFIDKKTLYRINYKERLPVDQTVAIANKFLNKEGETWKKYNVLGNNCEHFASCCMTGKPYSEQATRFIENTLKQVINEVGSPIDKPFT